TQLAWIKLEVLTLCVTLQEGAKNCSGHNHSSLSRRGYAIAPTRNCCNKRSTGAASPTDGGCAKLYQRPVPSSMHAVNEDTGSHIGTISRWKWLKVWRNAVNCRRLSALICRSASQARSPASSANCGKQNNPPQSPLGGRWARKTFSSCCSSR